MARKGNPEYDALVRQYKSLAKKADQRLVRLEQLSKQKGFRNVTKWAYARAMKDIKYWSGSEATRFNRDIPRNINSLKARISDVKHFLEQTTTSTKRGIMKTFKKRADTINKKYGTDFKWDDVADFYESKEWNDMDRGYGSETAMQSLGEIKKNEKAIKKSLKKGERPVLRIENKKVADAVNDILNKYGESIYSLY